MSMKKLPSLFFSFLFCTPFRWTVGSLLKYGKESSTKLKLAKIEEAALLEFK